MDMLSAGLTLLLIMDPLGNIPLFLSVLKTVDDESRKRQILIRELCFALLVLLIFLFVGQYLLLWLNLRQEAVSIAGGIVLFLISLRMIFPTEKGIMGEMPAGEPFFVPLAVPLLAGPSTLAMLILLARSQPDRIFEWLIAVLGAWVVTSLIMLSSTKLHTTPWCKGTHCNGKADGNGFSGNFCADAVGRNHYILKRYSITLIYVSLDISFP